GSPPGSGDPCDARSAARTGATAAQVRGLCIATGVPSTIVDSYQFTTVAIGTVASGSTALTPETADTYTAGVVWRPHFDNPWVSGLSVSVDYYDIAISNVISQVSAVTTLNKCYNLDGTNPSYSAANIYCQQVARDGTGGVSAVSTPYLNLGGLKTRGVDVQADWKLDFEEAGLGLPGAIDLNFVVNFTNAYKVQLLPGSAWVEYSGTIDGTQAATTPPVGLPLPKSKIFANLTYRVGPAEIGLRWRHLPKMDDVTSVTRPASPAPGVGSYDIFDLNGGWKFSDKTSLRAGVTNLFDKDPPVVGGTLGQTQPGTYDIIGRSFYLSLSSRF
ncbi:MAG: TonB-dependent receptor, partial [Caulobacter sp.]